MTNDQIEIEGTTMTVTTQKDNVHLYGHGHCFVGESESSVPVLCNLKRFVEVVDIFGPSKILGETTLDYQIKLNIENATEDEIAILEKEVIEIYADGTVNSFDATIDSDLVLQHTVSADVKLSDVQVIVEAGE
jgi:hypothetical protein